MRRESKRYKVLRGMIKTFFVFFLLFILGGVFFLTCKLDKVEFVGNTRYTDEELKKRIINKSTDGNTLLLYLRLRYKEMERIPFVEDVDMELINKNEVRLHIYEKKVTGCIEYMGGYMYFDKDGIIVESSKEKLEGVPFVTGLVFNEIVLYEKLNIQKEELFDVILNITQLIYKFNLSADTISINQDNEITLDLGDVKVLLGKRDTYDEQIAELKNIIPNTGGGKMTINMKNFTEGQDRIFAKPDE